MPLELRPLTPELEGEVAAFNDRLAHRGVRYQLPTRLDELIGTPESAVSQQLILALADGAVRGGYILKTQPCMIAGEERSIGNYQLPVSEGTTDPTYASIGAAMLLHALRSQPLLYALGIGGRGEQLTRMLSAAKWDISEVPFLFSTMRSSSLRRIPYLQSTRARQLAMRALTWSGTAAILATVQRLKANRGASAPRVAERFDEDADAIWDRSVSDYRLVPSRNSRVLNELYPVEDPRFHRLFIEIGGLVAGWSVVIATQMEGHNYFGDLYVGTIVDVFAPAVHTAPVMASSVAFLSSEGCDLIITNQTHAAWVHAAGMAGMLRGPSNYLLALSPALSRQLGGLTAFGREVHFTRGDGDGPINL